MRQKLQDKDTVNSTSKRPNVKRARVQKRLKNVKM